MEIGAFSTFVESFTQSGIGVKANLLQTTLHKMAFYKDAYEIFHVYTVLYQMISLADAIFQQELHYSCTETMKSAISYHCYLKPLTQYHNAIAESRTNAHWMKNVGAEILYMQIRGFN